MSCKIVALTSMKGGVGKSFVSYNYANYLSQIKHKHVLFFDLDSQVNDTMMIENHISKEQIKNSSIFRAFVHVKHHPHSPFPDNFKPFHINQYLDMFAGSPKMDEVDKMMGVKQNMTEFVLMRLMYSMKLPEKYDYIIIDTHNSFQDATINALICADYILVPTIPNVYSLRAVKSIMDKLNVLKDQFVDMKTGQSSISGKLYFIGNMIKFNTKASHEFVDAIKSNPMFIAGFHQRELINRADNAYQSVFGYAKNKRDVDVVQNEIIPQFNKITKIINQ